MKNLILFLFILPIFLNAQSNDGMGKTSPVSPMLLLDTEMADSLGIKSVKSEGNKIKKGFPSRIFEWYDYPAYDGLTQRLRRDFKADDYFYDEQILVLTPDQMENYEPYYLNLIRHEGNKLVIKEEMEGENSLIYDGPTKIYDVRTRLVQATIQFSFGRPQNILINHYYTNGQLQFVREIYSEGAGEPLRNIGVLEAYYPDGSVFENPLTEDGNAIIILNDQGEKEDECTCIGQDIMEWGRGYLYAFLGKYAILLEQIYNDDGLECCWE
jgi:hypothetical protein